MKRIILFTILVMIASFSLIANAEGTTGVYLTGTPEINRTGTVELALKAHNVTDLYTAQFELQYDPAKLELNEQGVTNLAFTGNNTYSAVKLSQQTGKLKVLYSMKGKISGISGNVDILNLKFKALTAGKTKVLINKAKLVNSQGKFITVSEQQGIEISVYNNTSLTVVSTPCEYSDSTTLKAVLTSEGKPVPGKSVTFEVYGSPIGTAITSLDGVATLNHVVNLPKGDYPVAAKFEKDDVDLLGSSEASTTLNVIEEKAVLTYTGQQLVQYPGAFTLSAKVAQDNDSSLGDYTKARVKFDVSLVKSDGTLSQVGSYVANCGLDGVATSTQMFGVGVYSITTTLVDDGYYKTTTTSAIAPVYDPNGGFATGGGWINVTNTEEGNLGRANFGFNAKYKDNSSTGSLEFQYKDGGINLKSKQIDWIVISSVSAQFQGVGTIEGREGTYTFRVECTDNDGSKKADKFTIKIWAGINTSDSGLVYKAINQDLGGGNVVVHTK